MSLLFWLLCTFVGTFLSLNWFFLLTMFISCSVVQIWDICALFWIWHHILLLTAWFFYLINFLCKTWNHLFAKAWCQFIVWLRMIHWTCHNLLSNLLLKSWGKYVCLRLVLHLIESHAVLWGKNIDHLCPETINLLQLISCNTANNRIELEWLLLEVLCLLLDMHWCSVIVHHLVNFD